MDYRADPLAPDSPDRYRETLNAFVAPVAHQADAVAKDPIVIQVAEAVYAAFGDHGVNGGLTRDDLATACSKFVPAEAFQCRFDLFVSMGLLRRNVDRSHQQRYVMNPVSVAALLVYGRLREAGGVEEIMTLLDRTRLELDSGELTRDALAERLNRARRGLSIFADHLLHLVQDRPWEELVAERSQHRSADRLLGEARELVVAFSGRFPDLSGIGKRLVNEALRYNDAVHKFCARVLEIASARRDFSMLTPEQYRSAALTCAKDELAVPLARTVFDPASVVIAPEEILSSVEEYRPPPARRRAPRPPSLDPEQDPVEEARRRTQDARHAIAMQAELHLQGMDEVDLTSRIRGAGWRGAARIVTDALIADADPAIPFRTELSKALLIDATGPVSHVTPVTLRRIPRRASESTDGAFLEAVHA